MTNHGFKVGDKIQVTPKDLDLISLLGIETEVLFPKEDCLGCCLVVTAVNNENSYEVENND